MKHKTAGKDVRFDKRAAKYDDGLEGRLSQKVYRLVLESVELNAGDKILDMGCGTGTILYRLGKRYHMEGYGIDMEAKMTAQAKLKCPQMHIQYGDCGKTPFKDGMFDCLTACMTFHHFYDQRAFAKEAGRILKTGGKLYLADLCFPGLIRRFINAAVKRMNLVGRFCTEQEMIQIFRPYGLKIKAKRKDGLFQILIFEKTEQVLDRLGSPRSNGSLAKEQSDLGIEK